MTYHATKRGSPRFRFITETIGELKKVVWLSRREAAYLTFLVLLISVLTGLVMGVFDFSFSQLVNKLFLGR